MTLSEELAWRGFTAETTISDLTKLDETTRSYYHGYDPSADSLQIGNLAALMMDKVFLKHGYKPYILIGGATGMIGDPKDTEERQLKALDEISHNKECIVKQFRKVLGDTITVVDNIDWFSEIKFIPFLREVGKQFSMTQLLDRDFVKKRIGEGAAGLSYAEFSYTLMQGYDFLHLYRTYGIDIQLCGADQFGNCVSGMHLIKRLEGVDVDIYANPLILAPDGRKFGKSEGNAVFLSAERTNPYDFYQFWLNLPDASLENYIKIYTELSREEVEALLAEHQADPSARIAQRKLAYEVTKLVHGLEIADSVVKITIALFGDNDISAMNESELELLANLTPTAPIGTTLIEALVSTGVAKSNSDARQLIAGNAISLNGTKVSADQPIDALALIKKGKNKFILVR
jgi:tyrosyl-tRNA synthetase